MVVERRQLLMGGAVVVVLVIAVTLLRPASPVPAPTAQARTQPVRAKSGRAAADAQTPGPVAPVKLKELADQREQPGEAKRNPFKFVPKAAAPIVKAPVVAPPPPTTSSEPPKPVITGPPPPPPIPLKLIGILERANGVKWAVLSDGKAATPFYGKDGDIVDGRWQIVQIGTESITMTYADGRGRTVIRLTGQ
jgi:hypothetical protein